MSGVGNEQINYGGSLPGRGANCQIVACPTVLVLKTKSWRGDVGLRGEVETE